MNIKSTILVVDDDLAHRTMLKTLLSGWGYAVAEADDGSAAIAQVRERPFDLILMDVRMVKVSGLEALAEIKAFNPAIPVIIMTGAELPGKDQITCEERDFQILQKPFLANEIINQIRSRLAPDSAGAGTR